jgi:hypothetical protein
MQERSRLSGLCLVLGLSISGALSCTPTERDLTKLLGVTDSGRVELDASKAKPDASSSALDAASDAAAATDAAMPTTSPPEAGRSEPSSSPEPDAAPSTETEPATSTEPHDAGTQTEETTSTPIDASVDAGFDSGQCAAVIETVCDDVFDDDCDGKTDCEDSDCSADAECCVAGSDTEVVCDDVKDDDCDGQSDCDDNDCKTDVSCQPPCEPVAGTEVDCADEIDDDCDTLIGCADAEDCGDALECQPSCVQAGETEVLCEDTLDDDCDGFQDCDDPDCAEAPECQTACIPVSEDCGDGVDDDCDGFKDCLDANCAPTAACCVESGSELCDDGLDNDCDGVIDCPVILSANPELAAPGRAAWEGGAVSAADAQILLDVPAMPEYVVQCRSAKPASIAGELFVVCNASDPAQLTVFPFDVTEGSNPLHDGVMETQVRFAYPNGQVSQPASYTYYVHSSLAGAPLCVAKASDAQYFAAAKDALVLSDSQRFRDDDANLAAPFVNIEFTPDEQPVFDVAAAVGSVEYLSLRRRFVLDDDKSMVLMKRVYMSRRAGNRGCLTAMIRKHDNDLGPIGSEDEKRFFRTGCSAVVMNKQGAGVCLVVDANGAVVIGNPNTSMWQYWNFTVFGWVDWATADNFMWRKLLSHEQGGELRVFSPKCYPVAGLGCTTVDADTLILPDRELFPL